MHQKYIIQTYADGISFETVYFLNLKCYEAQTQGVMDAFVTQASTVVRFFKTDSSTATEKITIGSSEGFSISAFESSTSAPVKSFANSASLSFSYETASYTPVETTNERSASSTYGHAASVFTTTTIPVISSSSAITTPVKGK